MTHAQRGKGIVSILIPAVRPRSIPTRSAHRIRGVHDYALYKSTFYSLTYSATYKGTSVNIARGVSEAEPRGRLPEFYPSCTPYSRKALLEVAPTTLATFSSCDRVTVNCDL